MSRGTSLAMAKADERCSPPLRSLGSPRLALIGCGAIAERHHLPALREYPAVMKDLILVDRDGDRAHYLASRFGAKGALTDYRQALDDVDAVILTVPTNLHHPIAMECLSRGVHVLCEKPLAESASRAREMVEQASRTGAVLAANYLQRLWPQFAATRELLASGSLGQLLSIKYFVGETFDWPSVSGFYFNSATCAGGVLRDRGAHVFDHICWWLGAKPMLLSSLTDSFGGPEAVAEVCFTKGSCVGEVRLSWLSTFPCRFELQCESGTVKGEVYDFRSLLVQTGQRRERRIALPSGDRTKVDVGRRIVGDFINVISKGGSPLIAGRDVLDSVEFIDECYAAATRFGMPWYGISGAEYGT